MTVIEAASHTSRVLVDGTLVLQVHIEPRFRDQAMQLFGAPGTAIALAALKQVESGKTQKSQSNQELAITSKRERMGPLCEWAVMRCGEPMFQRWVYSHRDVRIAHPGRSLASPVIAREYILLTCGVGSRKELDADTAAAERLHEQIRKPYGEWLKKQEATA